MLKTKINNNNNKKTLKTKTNQHEDKHGLQTSPEKSANKITQNDTKMDAERGPKGVLKRCST